MILLRRASYVVSTVTVFAALTATQGVQQNQSPTNPTQERPQPITVVVQEPPKDLAAEAEQRRRDERNVALQERMANLTQLLLIAAVMTLFFLGWQSWETRKSASAAQRAADLTRQQLVGTMGAGLNCTISLHDEGVSITLTNAGGVDARNVEGTVQITPVTLAELTPTTATKEHRFSDPVVIRNERSA